MSLTSQYNPGRILLLPLLVLLLSACTGELTELEKVLKSGELVVLTRNSGTTYYEGPFGPTGLEYDLVNGFAKHLGVKPRFIVADTLADLLGQLAEKKAHFAAAGLTITDPRKTWLNFTPSYQEVSQQLVYRAGRKKPKSLGQLEGHIEVVADSSHTERLRRLHHKFKKLSWSENHKQDSSELLTRVWEKKLDYTIVDSNVFMLNRHFMPELRVAFNIGKPQELAWAFPKYQDMTLYQAAESYINSIKKDGHINKLFERYYEHLEQFNYVGTVLYQRHIIERLPEYRKLFEYAANEVGLDWRLLAAVSYQESHWDSKAVSPTGVRGIMMLTRKTAGDIGVEKRTDPVQSIRGGAIYLKNLLQRVPERIKEPDRTWLALAAYNIGLGHVEDARIITQKLGGNPDSWKDVKKHLPKLRQKKWYKNTKRGYARGNEALIYVENIRSYYDILVWIIDRESKRLNRQKKEQPPALGIKTPTL